MFYLLVPSPLYLTPLVVPLNTFTSKNNTTPLPSKMPANNPSSANRTPEAINSLVTAFDILGIIPTMEVETT